MKKQNIDILEVIKFGAIAIALIFVFHYAIKMYRQNKAKRLAENLQDGSPVASGGSGSSITPSVLNLDKVLQLGSKGNEVRTLQAMLLNDGQKLPKYGMDGGFGNETLAALRAEKGVEKISINEYLKKG